MLCLGSFDLMVCGVIITLLNGKLEGLIYIKWGDSQKLTAQGESVRQRVAPRSRISGAQDHTVKVQ